MALTIYGSPRSRTMRVLWAAGELGLTHRHEPVTWDDPWLKSPAFLAINPAGTVPAINDDGFCLGESMAIVLHLAKTRGLGRLYPADPRRESEVWRWALWGQGHLEPWVQQDAAMAPLRARAPDEVAALTAAGLRRLESMLVTRPFLLGEAFTAADLCVAAILSPSRATRLDLAAAPAVADWLSRVYARPAAVAVRARFG